MHLIDELNEDKIALLSDIHWGIDNNSDTMLNVIKEYNEWYIKILKKQNINKVIFLGDWFESRTSISVKTLNVVYDILKKFQKENIHIYILLGNHDIYFKTDLKVNSLKIFSEFSNITLISKPSQLKIKDKSIFLFPWNTYSTNYGKCDLMLGHFNFQGGKFLGSVNKSGEHLSSLFKTSKLIYSGHFHLRNDYKQKNSKLTTIGSPLELDWSDFQNTKGIYIININDLTETFIENNISPKHVRIYFSKFKKKLEDLKNIKGNFVEFVVDKDYKYETIQKIKILINKHNPISDVKVSYLFTKKENLLKEMTFDENSDILKMSKLEYMIKNIQDRNNELQELGLDENKLIEKISYFYSQAKEKGFSE